MRDKINQMLKDKLFLVMLVLGLLTIVAAAGVFTVQRGNGKETSPYLEIPGPDTIAQEGTQGTPRWQAHQMQRLWKRQRRKRWLPR